MKSYIKLAALLLNSFMMFNLYSMKGQRSHFDFDLNPEGQHTTYFKPRFRLEELEDVLARIQADPNEEPDTKEEADPKEEAAKKSSRLTKLGRMASFFKRPSTSVTAN